MGRSLEKRAAEGTFEPHRSRRWRQAYSSEEIAALRADPRCMLPNRNLRSQWKKCHELGIPRDHDLRVVYERPPEVSARARARMKQNPEQLRVYWRRSNFRRSVRKDPEGVLDELRCLARGHQHAEDIILEGFATVLRLAVPAAEAFKIAKAEVNRTSAQPFKEQSFNPDIDYAARETGRQVARASDIRAARGEG
ncbi:hypothetical protein [Methylobacterium sp. UNC300MFChir4.1]|uniref:hypothetical protein n=1 Tax=Methylobacterium sp. UNC300MFChir4.1 TaxID=1502747 RepID=UPI0011133A21|nr:hypothetical protein [Methylobacterium sp. UNC300MFChir4.1]